MLKKIGIGVLVLVLLAAGGAWYLFSNLDGLIKTAIQTYGSAATQSVVTVDKVDISLSTGQGTITGISVGNPAGFSANPAVKIGAISVAIDPASVPGSGPIIIKLVNISQPLVNYEVNNQGGSNLQVLQHNVQAYAGGPGASAGANAAPAQPAPAASASPQRKEIIDDLTVDEGQVNASAAALQGRELKVPLGSLHLTGLGRSTNGATGAQIGAQILSAITAKAEQAGKAAVTKAAAGAALKSLGGAGGGVLGGGLKGLLGQ